MSHYIPEEIFALKYLP